MFLMLCRQARGFNLPLIPADTRYFLSSESICHAGVSFIFPDSTVGTKGDGYLNSLIWRLSASYT